VNEALFLQAVPASIRVLRISCVIAAAIHSQVLIIRMDPNLKQLAGMLANKILEIGFETILCFYASKHSKI